MKTNQLILAAICLFVTLTSSAQPGINYKAIINDASGDVLANTAITVQFTILEDGTISVFQETHNPTTDANGIIIVNIGEGDPISGNFTTIDWGKTSHYLKTEIDIGDGLKDMGTTEFKAVPYSLYAATAESVSGPITETQNLADVLSINNSAKAQIKDVTNPTETQDATTKIYVDNRINELQVVIDALTRGLTLCDGDLVDLQTDVNNCGECGERCPDGYTCVDGNCVDPSPDNDNDGWTVNAGDCDDNDPNNFPGNTEVCDARDNDCSGGPDYPGETIDSDGDGWVDCGDCDEDDITVYPGAPEICDDGIDQDCNGSDEVCIRFEIDTNDPVEAAASMGVTIGLLAAEWVFPDGSPSSGQPDFNLGHGVLSSFGPNVSPMEGLQMLALSTGTARSPSDPDYAEDLNKNYEVNLPPGFPTSIPGCSDPGDGHDGIGLKLTLEVPENATGFRFNYKFYSKDYPEYVCSSYADQAIAIMNPAPAGSIAGNIMFDSNGYPICSNSAATITSCRPITGYSCPDGISELLNTGFDNHGGSAWLQSTAPAQSETTFEIILSIWDSGDGNGTSTILFDNWEWVF